MHSCPPFKVDGGGGGGAILITSDGTLIGIHLATLNEAKELQDDMDLDGVAESVPHQIELAYYSGSIALHVSAIDDEEE